MPIPSAQCRLPNAGPMPSAQCAARLVRQHAHPHPHPKPKPNPIQHAHRIKGAAGNLGMQGLNHVCEVLEYNTKDEVWKEDMLEECRLVASAIKGHIEAIRQACQQ